MLVSKKASFERILSSHGGVHLTVYLENRGGAVHLSAQLLDAIQKANEMLVGVLSNAERKSFLKPLENLLLDARVFKNISGNVGIFRNNTGFRLLNIPVKVETTCFLATSFHVKPVLSWLQSDQDCLLMGVSSEAAYLYLLGQNSLKIVETFLFPDSLKHYYSKGFQNLREAREMATHEDAAFSVLNDRINNITAQHKPRLFLAGDTSILKGMERSLTYCNTHSASISDTFSTSEISTLCTQIRASAANEADRLLKLSIFEYELMQNTGRMPENIFQISKAVAQQRVSKLLVASDVSIFGKLHEQSGSLIINQSDIDHEDDDLLDDLAQSVLRQGGNVLIAPRDQIPMGRSVLAILKDTDPPLAQQQAVFNIA